MASPTFLSLAGLYSGTGAVAVGLGSHQADDILLVFNQCDNAASSLSTANGFATLAQSAGVGSGTNQTRCTVWWKRAASNAETGCTIGDSGDHNLAYSMVVRGCPTTGNPWIAEVNSTATATTAISIAGGTPNYTDTLTLFFCTGGGINSTTVLFSATGTGTNLSSLTERLNYGSAINNNGGKGAIYSGTLASPGAVGTLSGTCGQSVAQAWVVASFLSTTSVIPGAENGSGMLRFFQSRF